MAWLSCIDGDALAAVARVRRARDEVLRGVAGAAHGPALVRGPALLRRGAAA